MSEQQPQNLEPHVKEYMDSQNPTAYNTGAIESISAMPKDEKGLPIPKETAFNNSQGILGGDEEAMGRSLEMGRWSEGTGAYAEKASKDQQQTSKEMIDKGRKAEDVKKALIENAKVTAENGVNVPVDKFNSDRLIAKANGIVTVKPSGLEFDRSPTKVGIDQGIVNAAKKIVQ